MCEVSQRIECLSSQMFSRAWCFFSWAFLFSAFCVTELGGTRRGGGTPTHVWIRGLGGRVEKTRCVFMCNPVSTANLSMNSKSTWQLAYTTYVTQTQVVTIRKGMKGDPLVESKMAMCLYNCIPRNDGGGWVGAQDMPPLPGGLLSVKECSGKGSRFLRYSHPKELTPMGHKQKTRT